MKILGLTTENIKKVSLVEITPDGTLVQITGPNDAGKTSLLDSIWFALANQRDVQTVPIRKGAKKGRIKLTLGEDKVECIVTRTYTARSEEDGGGFRQTLEVTNEAGFSAKSPQAMLNGFIDALAFDPLAFLKATAEQQFNMMLRFLPGMDFPTFKKAQADDYAKRTEVNRQRDRAQSAADLITVAPDLPAEMVDVADLVDKLEKAGTHNTEIEQRKARRERVTANVEALGVRITELEAELVKAREEKATLEKRLADAGALPEPIDTMALRQAIDTANSTNAAIVHRQRREEHVADAKRLGEESDALTKAMDDRETAKRDAIAKAAFPVPGLSVDENGVLYNGVPFEQASYSAKLKTSAGIAMASNSRLRIMIIRNGESLDSKSLQFLADMATAAKYQIWIERMDESGSTGFVMEEGHLKGAPPPVEDPAAAAAEGQANV